MAKSTVPASPCILTRSYLRRLESEGVRKLSASHLKEVRRLERAFSRARAEIAAQPGSLLSRVTGGAL